MASVESVQFEHYQNPHTLGVHEERPRLSWKICHAPADFQQHGYEVELSYEETESPKHKPLMATCESLQSTLVPWPFQQSLQSRQRISIRIRVWDVRGNKTMWSDYVSLETGLLKRNDWHCERIAAPWPFNISGPEPEQLYRREFSITGPIQQARLYITAQGVYEAEINGQRVGDYFLAPGWTTYEGRLQYQTYDVTSALYQDRNCIGVRVAEGWFCGRIGFAGGNRNIWGQQTALMAQLEITYADGTAETVISGSSWTVTQGPIRLAEIYDGEKYDATKEVASWSLPVTDSLEGDWQPVRTLSALPESTQLIAGTSSPVRRIEVVKPREIISTPSGKTIIDFGQNLVGYLRLSNMKGSRGHTLLLSHAEVLENDELCTRPLRICEAQDKYTFKGATEGETYEPRFTFHGFRYAQIDGWPGNFDSSSVEAVVCHTEMEPVGSFSCSEELLNKLHRNIIWGMRGNFLSVPTDCPQRDERMGWSGDLALFAPTAMLLFNCTGMLSNWLQDIEYDQNVLGGVPPMVSPNSTLPDPVWCRRVPCAIWHDVTILAPWALYQETGDANILSRQYQSMLTWMSVLPRNKTGATHLWDNSVFQLGDWLDPMAPPDAPWKSPTDSKMVANMFLVHSLDLMVLISEILGRHDEHIHFTAEATAARAEFHEEYVTPNGRIVSDTQATYAIAICLDILKPAQRAKAGDRLSWLVRKNNFKISTGFAGTPFVCEALVLTGHTQVAYAMLLEKECPSWLYPVTMGATTVWERWDSMMPDGRVNPGEMTSFNHYAFGAIAKFMYERVAGLVRLGPGWKRCRIAPAIGATFSQASAHHVTPHGKVSVSWKTIASGNSTEVLQLEVTVPYGVTAEIILPCEQGTREEIIGHGDWSFQSTFRRDYEWPVEPLKPKS